jgi:hypothetical protein
LLYLVSGLRGNRAEKSTKSEFLLTTLSKSRTEYARNLLSVAIVASTIFSTISIDELTALQKAYANIPLPVYILVFNFFDLAPWQMLSLFGAFLTGIIFFSIDKVFIAWDIELKKDKEAKPSPFHVKKLLLITRLRNISSIFAIIMAFGYAMLVVGKNYLPEWLMLFLNEQYGSYLQ